MTPTPTDSGRNDASTAQDQFTGATIVMNGQRQTGPARPEEVAQADQLCETIPVARPVVERTPQEPTIEEYMAALLARTKQFSTVRPTRPGERDSSAPAQRKPSTPAPVTAPTPGAVPVDVAPAGPTPAPECRDAISELRELANISARSSVNAHRAQRLIAEMRGKRSVAFLAMIASVVLLSMAPGVRSLAYILAVAAVATACSFSMKYLELGRELASLCPRAPKHDA